LKPEREENIKLAKDISDFMLNGPQDLREGESYFRVTYCDTKSDIPLIETWIYVGKDLLEGDGPREAKWYFQDPDSYINQGHFLQLSKGQEHRFFATDAGVVETFFNFAGLRNALACLEPKNVKR
jgi:hypothetical protein